MLGLARCTRTRTVHGMDNLSDVSIVLVLACFDSHVILVKLQFPGDVPIVPSCLGSHAVLVPVQYLAWTA